MTGALAVLNTAPSASGHTAAVVRFCSVVTLYLWFLCAVVWSGINSTGSTKIASLIGASQAKEAGALRTAAATVATFAALLVLGSAANLLLLRFGAGQAIQGLVVRNPVEAFAFLTAAVSAGFVEELVFRGYLQQQLYARTGSIIVASALQVAIFTLGHVYQGWMRLIPVALEGAVLTAVALWRRSLVPGMIAHGLGDGLMSIAFVFGLITR